MRIVKARKTRDDATKSACRMIAGRLGGGWHLFLLPSYNIERQIKTRNNDIHSGRVKRYILFGGEQRPRDVIRGSQEGGGKGRKLHQSVVALPFSILQPSLQANCGSMRRSRRALAVEPNIRQAYGYFNSINGIDNSFFLQRYFFLVAITAIYGGVEVNKSLLLGPCFCVER